MKFSDYVIDLSGERIVLDSATSDVNETYIQNIYSGHDKELFFERNGLQEKLTDTFKPRIVKEILA